MAKCYHVDGIHQSFQDNHHDEVDESDGDDNDNVFNDYVEDHDDDVFYFDDVDDDDGGDVVHLFYTSEAIWHSPPFSIC